MENNETMTPEEEISVLTLTDENGAEQEFEFLDVIEYEGSEYLFLLPMNDENGELLILKVEPVDEETESYVTVDDEALLDTLFGMFKEKFADYFTFEE
jgi:uncharacterized protein YrzB (UPF0473 family)